MKDLMVLEEKKAVEVFGNEKSLKDILDGIKKHVNSFVPDLTTKKGRDEIKSMARKVSTSKVKLDDMGKEVIKMHRDSIKEVQDKIDGINKGRKEIKEALDALRDSTRQPLTDWENEEKERKERELAKAQLLQAHIEALAENEFFDKQREMEKKEIELKKREQVQKEKEEREKAKLKAEAEKNHIKKEAEAKAKKEAEDKLKNKQAEAQRKIAKAKENEEKAKREKIEIKANAEKEKNDAVKKALKEEQDKQQKIKDEKARQDAVKLQKSQDEEHRRNINKGILKSFVDVGVDTDIAKKLILEIRDRKIGNISINY